MLRSAGPDFLAVDHEMVALAARPGADRAGVAARRWFGHAEGLEPQAAPGDFGEPAPALGFAPVPKQGPHGIHLGMAGGGIAAQAMHLLQDPGRRADALAAAAIGLGNQDREQPRLGHGLDELRRIDALAIEPAPVIGRETGHDAGDQALDLRIRKGAGRGGGGHEASLSGAKSIPNPTPEPDRLKPARLET